jgi:hypothetical protein
LAIVALAFGGWACSGGSTSSTGSGTGSGSTGSGSTSNGKSGGSSGAACSGTGGFPADAGMCEDQRLAPSPLLPTACDPCGDVATECPLPPSQMSDDGTFTTIYYFSDPICRAGFCTYCMTRTSSEDPCATALCQ